jgi:hypothetical protein
VEPRNDSRTISKRHRNFGRSTSGRKGREAVMARRKFSDTIKDDLETNVEFRGALLSEAVACMVSGDVETGKVVLREYVNGTIGFLKRGAALG